MPDQCSSANLRAAARSFRETPHLRGSAAADTGGMSPPPERPLLHARPRIIVLGAFRDAMGMAPLGLASALDAEADIRWVPARSPVRHTIRALRDISRAFADGYEALHIMDARFAPLVRVLQRRNCFPASVTVSARDVRGRDPISRLARRSLPAMQEAFATDVAAERWLRRRAPSVQAWTLGPAADVLPWPSTRDVNRVMCALRGKPASRMVIAVPWPENRHDLRWFRDVVMPQLDARPLCLLLGAPPRRESRLLLNAVGWQQDFHLLRAPLHGGVIAAAARVVDAFVVPASADAGLRAESTALMLALAASGAPVVTDGREPATVLAHEHGALLVEPGDERGMIATLNRLLGLPAIQRRYLGEEFARNTIARWSWDASARLYGDRFATLVGRPRIPAELRAA